MSYQIERAKRFLDSKMSELEESKLLPLNLQYFADGEDSGDEGDSDDGDSDDSGDDDSEGGDQDPSLDELLKNNPDLKKQFDAMFKDRFKKRLKGIDLKKAKQLLKAEQGKDSSSSDEDPEDIEESKVTEKALKLERKLKRTAVKEYALDNGLNPKLVARLIDLDSLELDEDGDLDPDELEEAIEELTEEFPEIFRKSDQTDDDEDSEDITSKKKSKSHTLGGTSYKKTNKKNDKTDLRDLGAQIAKERAEKRKQKAFK